MTGRTGPTVTRRQRRPRPARRAQALRPGAALRAIARHRLRRAGISLADHGEVLVAHPRRSVWRARTTDGELVYVKVDGDAGRVQREHAAITAAAALGVPVPAPLCSLEGRPSLLVLGAVPGEPLRNAEDRASWRAAGVVLASLHAAPPPAALPAGDGAVGWLDRCRQQLDDDTAALGARGLLPADAASAIHERLDTVFASMEEPRLRFVHGDCMAKHVLVEGPAVGGVVDWADARGGDPLWDLAVASQFVPERLPAMLEGYSSSARERTRISTVLPAYWQLRRVRAAAWTADHGFDPTPHLSALQG